MKLSEHRLEQLIPARVLSGLSTAELREVRRSIRRPFTFLVDQVDRGTSNRGLWYLFLSTPFKYEALRSEKVDEGSLLELLAFDSSRTDDYFRLLRGEGSSVGLWEQYVSSLCAALTNPNLSAESAEVMLGGVVRSGSEHLSEVDAAAAVGEVLVHRWRSDDLSVSVCEALVEFFSSYRLAGYVSWCKGE